MTLLESIMISGNDILKAFFGCLLAILFMMKPLANMVARKVQRRTTKQVNEAEEAFVKRKNI